MMRTYGLWSGQTCYVITPPPWVGLSQTCWMWRMRLTQTPPRQGSCPAQRMKVQALTGSLRSPLRPQVAQHAAQVLPQPSFLWPPLSGTVVCNAGPEQVPPPPTSTVGYWVEHHSGEEPALPNSPSVCTCDQPHKLLGRGSRDDLLEAELMAMFSMGSDSPARMPPPDVPDKAPAEPRSTRFNWRASMGHPYVRMLSMAEARCHRQRPGTRRGLRPRRIHRNTGRLMRTTPGTRTITEDGSGHKCPIRSWRLLITWDRLEPLWLDFFPGTDGSWLEPFSWGEQNPRLVF